MAEKKIKVFAGLSPEYLYDKGIESGLSEKAADFFRYFNEVEITATVDSETGKVLKAEVTGDYK